MKNEIKIKKVVVLILFVLIAGLLSCGDSGSVNTGNFPKRWGTDAWSGGTSVAVDSSDNVFVTGYTQGDLDGNTNSGGNDIFLTKIDKDGKKLWTRQWGTDKNDGGASVAVDSSDNVFVTGSTRGDLDGNTNAGESDIFLTKFDNDGEKLWTKQWGIDNSDTGNSVAVDSSGNVFVTGETHGNLDGNTNAGESDIFLTKFDNDGEKLWTRQWGTDKHDKGTSVAVDNSGNVFVTGRSNQVFSASDIFLTKFDNDGEELWEKQWGTDKGDGGNSVAVDSSGNVFVTGFTFTDTSGYVMFLTKFDNDGEELWEKQWGTTLSDMAYSAAVDSSGNVFVTGFTQGDFDGNTNADGSDIHLYIFLTKFDGDGKELWTKQWGTGVSSVGYSVAVDSSDNVFVTGGLDGDYNRAHTDIFLVKTNNDGEFLE